MNCWFNHKQRSFYTTLFRHCGVQLNILFLPPCADSVDVGMAFVTRCCTVCSFALVSIFSHSHKNYTLAMLPPSHSYPFSSSPTMEHETVQRVQERDSSHLNTRFYPVTPNKVYYNGNCIRRQSKFVTADLSMPITHMRKVRK